MARTTDQKAFSRALAGVPRFVYSNGPQVVLLSIAWVVASLPLVTIGPATLGVYRAILDLRSDRNRIDWANVKGVLRESGVAAMLLSGLPLVFGVLAVNYGIESLQSASLLGEVFALAAAYVAVYLVLVLMPAFLAMAQGHSDIDALKQGMRWVATHPTAALTMGLLTLVTLAISILLTIGFVLLFAGVAFALQIEILSQTTASADDETTALFATATR